MQETATVRKLVDTIHQLHDGLINLSEAKRQAYHLFRSVGDASNKDVFNLAFPVLVKYFLDPTRKASAFLQKKEISKDVLLTSHRFIKKSRLAKMMFLSNRYPRSLLAKSATSLLSFMERHPSYLSRIMQGELVGPMMLEIHPTNATCTYKCRMCIWCGGQKQNTPIEDFYGTERLLNENEWCRILEEAKSLGTKQIIFSGGGETLLSQDKIKPVLDKANSLDFETMIYTNGRTLCNANPSLLESIMSSDWLRISLHAATPEIYSQLINRPLKANDLESVLNGIKKIISTKKQTGSNLKVGIGVVLQEINYTEVAKIANLSADLGIDFLDVRIDCVGVTEKLSEYQYENMLGKLRELRFNVESGQSEFGLSLADDLLIAMDKWKKIELTQPKRCLISVVRPAIDPFGIVGACDSIGEPYTRSKSPEEYIIGQVSGGHNFTDIMHDSVNKELGINCKFWPSPQILNTDLV